MSRDELIVGNLPLGTGNKGGTDTEKLFVQERFYNEYLQKIGRLF